VADNERLREIAERLAGNDAIISLQEGEWFRGGPNGARFITGMNRAYDSWPQTKADIVWLLAAVTPIAEPGND